jgi:RNA polymerase sigma-54 factor
MALSQRLLIRQSQALVMTPQLMQAIKLLQLSNLDLVAYVEAELERNPLLDRGAEPEPTGEPDNAPSADQPVMDGELRNGSEVGDNPHRELELNGHVQDDAPGTSPG